MEVILAYDQKLKHDVACKVFDRSNDDFEMVEREIRIHQSLRHPHIAPILDVVYTEKYIFMVMDLYENGDLLTYFSNHGLNHHEAMRLFEQIVDAVNYLHSRAIAHLDIKPENIFIDKGRNVFIGDFGCCETPLCRKKPFFGRGTLVYSAPEIFLCNQIDNRPADIWSLGVLLYTMLTNRLPWAEGTETEIVEQISIAQLLNVEYLPFLARIIISKCCRANVEERTNSKELLEFLRTENYRMKEAKSMKPLANSSCKKIIVKPRLRNSQSNPLTNLFIV